MKKNNVKTTPTKQRKQAAAKARRKRRVAARNLVVQRRLRPILKHIQGLEKQIAALTEKLAATSVAGPAAPSEAQS